MKPVIYEDCPVCKGNPVVNGSWCGYCSGAGVVAKPLPTKEPSDNA